MTDPRHPSDPSDSTDPAVVVEEVADLDPEDHADEVKGGNCYVVNRLQMSPQTRCQRD